MDNCMIDNMCRICLQRQDTLFSLFRKIKGFSPYEKLVNKTQLKIEANDAGPSSICSQCLIELDTTVNFLEKCEQSNQILSSRIQTEQKASIHSDLKTGTNVGTCDRRCDEESLYKGVNGTESRVIECIPPEVCEKVVESDEDASEALQSPAPAALEATKCPVCGSLRRCHHWAPPATYTCNYCQKVMKRKFNFKLHLKRHLGEKEWPCPSCGACFLTRGMAQQHCKPRRRRACPEPGCGKTFTSNTNLTTHSRVHSGERPHVCSECGKTFTSKNILNSHLRIHSGLKPYICPVCGRQFTTNKLSAHVRTHADGAGRAHACAACGRAFACARDLRRHAATHGPRAPRHVCTLCPRAYQHSQSLRKHTRAVHENAQPQPHE